MHPCNPETQPSFGALEPTALDAFSVSLAYPHLPTCVTLATVTYPGSLCPKELLPGPSSWGEADCLPCIGASPPARSAVASGQVCVLSACLHVHMRGAYPKRGPGGQCKSLKDKSVRRGPFRPSLRSTQPCSAPSVLPRWLYPNYFCLNLHSIKSATNTSSFVQCGAIHVMSN